MKKSVNKRLIRYTFVADLKLYWHSVNCVFKIKLSQTRHKQHICASFALYCSFWFLDCVSMLVLMQLVFGPVYTIPFSFHIGLVSYWIGPLFTRDRFSFHIGLVSYRIGPLFPRDRFISYRIGLLFTRARTTLKCFIPFSQFQMKMP